ncbi:MULTISPECIES: sugar-binding transcriptional regulator [Pasteurellaceae]|uniref:Transcriptional regulator, DeoR family n=2 Tax=Pasteurellaceae TaxID=712 RepID=A6VPN8_ACTSZ|nr:MULTISPECIES: sugar-binding transcriptional regulator [Pasteurellaceae]ABR74935.1 transcriptional regulator, DeoR family [Actinobacillus succinogenes 130Z]PHI40654.1 transcriptional regulator [Actinobacillus succinogenes]QIM68408.1 transcriptional regulator [Basfia succiniciproducens]SCX74872.1 DNA-binding transcriptional regulator LsrR, DeoR family [Basfia succiniciproducens]SEP71495.1 DNA-binding transcriptional regulator LsrR, DeoR family [Basfia succiniciproducens]
MVEYKEGSLLTEIAIAYYEHELTQEEIANKFNISRIKVGRLLKKARQEGIVEINVKYHPVFTSQLEDRLIEQFGIQRALIAIDEQNESEQREQVATLVSSYLSNTLKDGMTVAVGQGRNVAAVGEHIGIFPEKNCKFICGIGGVQRLGDPVDADHICRNLARKFNGANETLYAPAYLEDKAFRDVFMKNGVIKETLDRARKADIALVGIGDMSEESYMVQLGWFTPKEITEARMNLGVIGDIAGYGFFNLQGEPVDTVMNNRVIGLSLEDLRAIPCVIGIASESSKAMAILGALRTGIIDIIATSASNINSILNLIKG